MNTAEAIRFFGSKAALARAINVTKQAIGNWGEYPPEARQYQIQLKSAGELVAEPEKKAAA